jgi:hypothetical protein
MWSWLCRVVDHPVIVRRNLAIIRRPGRGTALQDGTINGQNGGRLDLFAQPRDQARDRRSV